MKKTWLYVRDSMSKEALAIQVEEIKRFAKNKQFKIIGTSSEICQGHDIDRQGLSKAVQMVRDGQADTLLIYSLDRIADDPSEIKEFAGQIGDPDAVCFVKSDDAIAWKKINDILQGKESPLQSDLPLSMSMYL